MALPTDSSDTFVREVEENLRRDQAQAFVRKYGALLIGAVVLFLAAIAGWLYWKDRQAKQSAEHSEQLQAIFTDIGSGKTGTVPQRLDSLAKEGGDIARASALFARASLAIDQDDRALAIAKYREVQEDGGLPQPYRDIALIRATALEFDSLKPEQVIERMEPLTKPGNPWFGSAGELTAMAYLRQNKTQEAGRLFAAIAADNQVPATIRGRAVQIAGTLGVDASAAIPMPGQQE